MNEVTWKPIYSDGQLSRFEISNSGQIRSLDNDLLSPYMLNSGYMAIVLKMGGQHYHYMMHRLVALAFIPNPGNKPQVNHINGIKTDNRVKNLEWVTRDENMQHAARNNLLKPRYGSTSPFAKHTEAEIHRICKYLENPKFTIPDIVAITGSTMNTVRGILYRGKWKQISSQYDFSRREHISAPLDPQTRADMRTLAAAGYSSREILNELGMPVTTANQLRINRCVREVRTFNDHPFWVS